MLIEAFLAALTAVEGKVDWLASFSVETWPHKLSSSPFFYCSCVMLHHKIFSFPQCTTRVVSEVSPSWVLGKLHSLAKPFNLCI